MSSWKSTCRFLALVAIVGMITPRPLLHAEPQRVQAVSSRTEAPNVLDVALNAHGVLVGSVVDAQGQPAVGVPVQLKQGDAPIAETMTDDRGAFAVASLRGGYYQLRADRRVESMRVWTANAAPPRATDGITVVVGSVTRGQGCTDSCTGDCGGSCTACGGGFGGGPLGFLMNPLVIGAAVAAAIAIPLAVSNDDDDPSGS